MMRLRTYWTAGALALGLAVLIALAGSAPSPSAQAQGATQSVELTANICNNVALTWPGGTPISTVAAAIQPASALESIWKQTIVGDRQVYVAWSPLPGAPNDFTGTETQLDAVFICVRGAASLERPRLGG